MPLSSRPYPQYPFSFKAVCKIILLSMLFVPSLHAQQGENSTQGKPVCTAANEQHFPDLAADGERGVIIAWQDARNEDRDVFAQRVGANGDMLWATDGVQVCGLPSEQIWPTVVSDANGGAIIVFGDGRNGNQDIYAQRVDGSGKPLWQQDGIPVCVHTAVKTDMRAIADETGDTIVVWEDWRDGNQDIYAQKISARGQALWNDNGVPVYRGEGDQYDPFLTADGEGGAIVVWWDISTVDWDVFAQRLNKNGKPLWTETGVPVCTAAGHQSTPFVVPDGIGGVFSVWLDYRNDANLLSSADIYVQRIDATGEIHWQTDGIALCDAPSNQQVPVGITDGRGGLIVVWRDDRDIFSDIYAQKLSPTGDRMWQDRGVPVCTAEGEQRKPAIVSDGSHGAIVCWLDYREDYGNVTHDAIYAQRIDGSGRSLWKMDGIPVCTADGSQTTPRVVAEGDGGAVIVWTDSRGESTDIYFQRVP
ncbi:MAG: hypothetical protein OXN17_03225 [Candidatus Poribacteria bacterium]|nr:hypothetical protein [Candidatus Poribacteria bacterium]